MRRRLLAAAAVLAGLAGAVGIARAESSGLVVLPPFQEVSLPGTSGSVPVEIKVTNRSDSPQSLTAQAVDFKALDESGGVAFVGLNGEQLLKKYGLATWIKLPKGNIDLAPGQSANVTAQIENGPNLAPGGHYGAVVFRVNGNLQKKPGSNLGVQQVFASLIFAKKTDGARFGLALKRVDKPDWRGGAVKVGLHFANTGNVHAVPRGTVRLLGHDGKAVQQGIINDESKIILPEVSRKIDVPLTSLKPVTYGTYTLQVQYRYDGTEKVSTYSETIRLVNWRLIAELAVGGLALIGLAAGAIRGRAHRRKTA